MFTESYFVLFDPLRFYLLFADPAVHLGSDQWRFGSVGIGFFGIVFRFLFFDLFDYGFLGFLLASLVRLLQLFGGFGSLELFGFGWGNNGLIGDGLE